MIDLGKQNWLRDLLPQVVEIGREAGRAVMKVYGEANPRVEYKEDRSPLTQADIASHHTILSGLREVTPEWPVLSEESKEIPFEERRRWQYFWLVDPLDGTKEFLKRNGEFTTNIALMENAVPILGVVYAPVIEKMYYAARGEGSWSVERETVTQIRTRSSGNGKFRVVMSRSHYASGERDVSRFTGGRTDCEFVSMGSSLKFCLVAEGTADIYPRTGPTMEWDTAAAHCIVEQAGGSVTDLDGNPLKYNKPVLLNPGFVVWGSTTPALSNEL